MKPLSIKYFNDYLGITSSSLCLIHCIVMPMLLAWQNHFLGSELWNYAFLCLSFWAVFQATRIHSSALIQTWLWCFFSLLTFCILFENDFHQLHEVTYIASVGLTIGHVLNIRHCKKCTSSSL